MGFQAKEEAMLYLKEKQDGHGCVCWQKSETEKRGRLPEDYEDCVKYGGLSRSYPHAVIWRETQL